MTLLQAIILGIVQGLTEFIPISSSGHLILAERLMGLDSVLTPEQVTAFIAVIQLGTLVAVLVYFATDIAEIVFGFISGTMARLKGNRRRESMQSARMGWLIIAGSVPIATVGIAAKKLIEGSATKNLYLISASMVVWALLLWLSERLGSQRKGMDGVGLKEALVVGIAQVFALIPGSSRSGTTITGALLMDLNRETAARFSFLLSIPAVAASGLLEMREAIGALEGIGALNLIVATVVSAIVGYASIAFLIAYLRRHSTYLFVGYRLILGAVLFTLAAAKVIPAY